MLAWVQIDVGLYINMFTYAQYYTVLLTCKMSPVVYLKYSFFNILIFWQPLWFVGSCLMLTDFMQGEFHPFRMVFKVPLKMEASFSGLINV